MSFLKPAYGTRNIDDFTGNKAFPKSDIHKSTDRVGRRDRIGKGEAFVLKWHIFDAKSAQELKKNGYKDPFVAQQAPKIMKN